MAWRFGAISMGQIMATKNYAAVIGKGMRR